MTPVELVVHVGAILDELGVRWVLGGSLASSLIGEPRSTLDIDVAIELERDGVAPMVAAVQTDFYVSEQMAFEAVEHSSSFNLVHYKSALKVDLFVLGDRLLDQRQLDRRQAVTFENGHVIWVGAPDDQVLRKLQWYRAGGEVSDRQWRDVVAILVVQAGRIDHVELQNAAASMGLADLAARAIAEADDSTNKPAD